MEKKTLDTLLQTLPGIINIQGREGCLTLSNDSPGWNATYMFYDYDLFCGDTGYWDTPLEAVEALCTKLSEIGNISG